MPNPKQYKSQKNFMKDCLHRTLHMEKKEKDQAIAQCLQMWRDRSKKNKKKMAQTILARVIVSFMGQPQSVDDVLTLIKRHSGTASVKILKKVGEITSLSVFLKNGLRLSVVLDEDSPETVDVGLLNEKGHLIELPKSIKFRDGTFKVEKKGLNTLLDWIRNDILKELQKNNISMPQRMAQNIIARILKSSDVTGPGTYTLYHGTDEKITVEELEEKEPPYAGSLGKGIYFGQNKETAKFYGPNIIEVTVELKKPLIIDAAEGTNYRIDPEIEEHYQQTGGYDSILQGESIIPFDAKIGGKWHPIRDHYDLSEIGSLAEDAGHDAVVLNNVRERSSVNEEVIVFDKKSIKK